MSISTSFKVSVGLVQKSFRRSYAAPGDGVIPQAKQKYVSSSGNYPQGFLAGSAHVGVKVSNTKFDDLALVTSDTPCMAAAVFTKNKFQAAPVTVTRDMLRAKEGQGIHSIIVNSGCANAVTGKGGLEDARRMGLETDKCLPATAGRQSEPLSSIVMSTGVIGQRLPIAKIISGIPRAVSKLGSEHDHWMGAAKAICTTDTFPKLLTKSFTLPSHPGTTFSMAGMTKGAGMIHPNMATLLGIICTDARVSTKALQSALKIAVDRSFNSISIDGDTSTNDTVAILANGAAIHRSSWSRDAVPDDPQNGDYQAFSEALNALTASLAQLVVRDGEGATKFVTIRVAGAQSHDIGHKIASTIARSPLVKTALYGRDANWGRILCAIGYAEHVPDDAVVPEQVGVSFVTRKASDKSVILEELDLLVNGEPQNVDEAKAAEILAEEDLEILVRLQPKGTNTDVQDVIFWTCDFSHEYVTINGDYRT